MPLMTTAQARVTDPVLTTVAQGHRNGAMVGMELFPAVPVLSRGGKIVTFGREEFRHYESQRVPGSNTKRVSFGHGSDSYALENHSLEGLVPFELLDDASRVPGIDLGNGAVQKVQNIIALRLEKAQASIATAAGRYAASNKITLSGTSQWSDYSGSSAPMANVETAKAAIRAQIGRLPNTVVMGPAVWAKLKEHPQVVNRIKYTRGGEATPEILASLFGVQRVHVGEAVYEDEDENMLDVWGKSVVLAYTEIQSLASMGAPSYGYTYRLKGYPLVEEAYQDRSIKSWVYPVTDEAMPVLASPSAGYLISSAVA